MPGQEYREKEIKRRILAGEYPHHETHETGGGDEVVGVGGGIISDPPTGKDKVVNIFFDPVTDEKVIETQ